MFNIEGSAKRSSRRPMQTNWRPSALPVMRPSANRNTKQLTGALRKKYPTFWICLEIGIVITLIVWFRKFCTTVTDTECRVTVKVTSNILYLRNCFDQWKYLMALCLTMSSCQIMMVPQSVSKTVYESVCSTVYEEHCSGSGYKKHCSQVPKQSCKQVPKEVTKSPFLSSSSQSWWWWWAGTQEQSSPPVWSSPQRALPPSSSTSSGCFAIIILVIIIFHHHQSDAKRALL